MPSYYNNEYDEIKITLKRYRDETNEGGEELFMLVDDNPSDSLQNGY